jgi:hypothetical protein
VQFAGVEHEVGGTLHFEGEHAPRSARLPGMKQRRTMTCPHCEATVPAAALACPECGSDARTGWSADADAWAGDLPTGYDDDPDFDYEENLRAEGLAEGGRPSRETIRRRRLAAVCVLLVACILAWLVWR